MADVLDDPEKIRVVNLIQARWGQAHIGDHKGTGYDRACRDRLTLVTFVMTIWEKSSPSDGKLNPPYGVVERIDLQSSYMLNSIMPRTSPKEWTQWVSNYAQDFTTESKRPFRGTIKYTG